MSASLLVLCVVPASPCRSALPRPRRHVPLHHRLGVPVRRIAAFRQDIRHLGGPAVIGYQGERGVALELVQQVVQESEPDPQVGLPVV